MDEVTQPKLKARVSPAGLLVLLGLAAWNLWVYLPLEGAASELTYSAFLAQVDAGNVASLTITGSLIEGLFLQPLAAGADAGRSSRRSSLAFRSVIPLAAGDGGLLSRLEAHHVQVSAEPPAAAWLTAEGAGMLPLALLLAALAWVGAQDAGSRAKPRRSGTATEHPDETFADASGADEAAAELHATVDLLRRSQGRPAAGFCLLLAGPEGAGKALLARAAAGEAQAAFLHMDAYRAAEQPDAAQAASLIAELFTQARRDGPAVIFIDHIEALGKQTQAAGQALYSLLAEMHRLKGQEGPAVVLLAATSHPEALDPALQRPGLFSRMVAVSLPDRQGREGILRIHTRGMALAADVNLGRLARTTTGFSGADLAALCREAGQAAERRQRPVTGMDDFEDALDRILLGSTRAVLLDDHERRAAAYHAAGHALAAWLTAGPIPAQKWSILPQAWGREAHEELPGRTDGGRGEEALLRRIAVLLGGRAAEEIALGELFTASESDLSQANQLARRMVTSWGMGSLGLLAFPGAAEPGVPPAADSGTVAEIHAQPEIAYSEEIARRIERDVQRLLEECYEADRRLFAGARAQLDELALALIQDESIDTDSLGRILGARGAVPIKSLHAPAMMSEPMQV